MTFSVRAQAYNKAALVLKAMSELFAQSEDWSRFVVLTLKLVV
jgi:hypothetical protein